MPTPTLGRLLVVDDETQLMAALCESLTAQGYEVVGLTSGEAALSALRDGSFEVLLTDLMMPGMDGIALLRSALDIDPNLVGVIMTGQGTVQTAVEAMKAGAFDYVLKPFKLASLMPVLHRAMRLRQLRDENVQLRESVAMHQLSQAITHTLDAETILEMVADAAIAQCEADEASILLPTEDGTALRIAAVRGESRQHLLGREVPIGDGIVGWVARHLEPLTLHGEVTDPCFRRIKPRSDIRSAISMPMIAGGKLVGVLNVSTTRHRRPFTSGVVKALSILVGTATSALENASLYAQVRETEKKYRTIFENACEGIFQISPDGRWLTANPAMVTLLGYGSLEELLRNGPAHIDRDERLAEMISRMQRDGAISASELQVRRSDGRTVWLSVNARAVHDGAGNLLCYEGAAQDITHRKEMEERLAQSLEKLRTAMDGTIQTMAAITEMRDPYTAGHQRRVSKLAHAIALAMGLADDEVDGIRVAASIHDMGKVAVPAEILSKPGQLSPQEMSLIRIHPGAAAEILGNIQFPWPAASMVAQHHERLDGSGYPAGLRGDDILLGAQIIAVADVVEAMASHRPYRPALGLSSALQQIRSNRGSQYRVDVVDACLQVFAEGSFAFG